MPRVVGIDHLVLSVGDFARSKEFYRKLLGFLGFKLKHEYADMAGWSNGKTLFWIAAAEAAPGQKEEIDWDHEFKRRSRVQGHWPRSSPAS
ncbi:MAG: hypothetical protein E6G78_07130 [Alphaproteobacteria bacterium]|nr:MAG: hypothetical protein E6G78_07130 [Alphaproteobacteria bacterium]